MKRNKTAIHFVAALFSTSLLTCSALAEWEVINLHPAGADSSWASGISGGQQVGVVLIAGVEHAALWTGTAESFVDLNPPGYSSSETRTTSGAQQVGWARTQDGSYVHAGMWSGTAESFVDLNPVGSSHSAAWDISCGQQVGSANTGMRHAGIWSGTAESFVDLNPVGSSGSAARAISGGQQVGYADTQYGAYSHAGMWSGTAESFVDLHPAGYYSSVAYDISDGQQVGVVWPTAYYSHASLWSGTAKSFVNLNPAGSFLSDASGVSGGYQVGAAHSHAALWNGTPESWVDLNGFLPTGYIYSSASDIEVTAADIWIVGGAKQHIDPPYHAFLWHYIIPAPSAASRRSHEAAGTFDMAIPAEGVLVDPRQNGAAPAMVLTYEMAPADPGCAGVSIVNGTCNETHISGKNLIIDMTYDWNTCVEVTVGNHTFRVLTHEGDVNADGDVNVIDLQAVKNHLFEPVDSAKCRCDVNCDGQINVIDLQQTKNNVFAPLPLCE